MRSPIAEAGALLRAPRRITYRWWLLVAAVLAMAVGSGFGFWTYGLYVEPLEQEFGWSRAELSLGFSLALLTGGLTGPLAGRWIDRRGPRSAILAGALATGVSYLLLGAISSLWQWYALWAINGVARQFMFFLPFIALVSKWFDRERGLAMSILGTGFSLGGFLVLPLTERVLDAFEWRGAFAASGIVTAVVFGVIGLAVVRDAPQATDDEGQAVSLPGVTLRAALRTPLFWVLAIALTLFFYGSFGWLVHQVPFYESVGIDRSTAARIVALSAGASIVTRLAAGAIADRVARFEAIVMALAALLLSGLCVLLISTSPPAIALFLLLWVMGTSGGPMIEALILTRAFGVAHFGSILGAIILIETGGQIVSPIAAGAIYDETGSYSWALAMFAATFAGALLLFALALRIPHPAAEPRK